MKIYTLNVGQGQFVVVVGKDEAFIVDTYVPFNSKQNTEFIQAALPKILAGKHLSGLVVTGFDDDHFCEPGMKIVLNKYRPDWLMYPKYFKETKTADSCFASIETLQGEKALKRVSVALSDNKNRFYNSLGKEFTFEIFSPHAADMNSSNNCSIVCKVVERATGASYLITGDTECDRWSGIVAAFSNRLKVDVLAAPHHGSENGITKEALQLINPQTTLVSAGVENQYGHPDISAMRLFDRHSKAWYQTNDGTGRSWVTEATGRGVSTAQFDTAAKKTNWI